MESIALIGGRKGSECYGLFTLAIATAAGTAGKVIGSRVKGPFQIQVYNPVLDIFSQNLLLVRDDHAHSQRSSAKRRQT